MVGNITSLTGNGLRDWLIQRVTAVIMLVYLIVIGVFLFQHPEMTYDDWTGFFACPWIRVINSIVWLSMITHAWIGLWTVTTDYLKSFALRLTVQMLIIISLLGLFFWGILVFWGV